MSIKLAAEPPANLTSPSRRLAPQRTGFSSARRGQSLFEHVPWFYVFCREKLFRDDTEQIAHVLWPDHSPTPGTRLLELGCGPGFYACRLALRYPQLSVVGVDRSERQLAWAKTRARSFGLKNCEFHRSNALAMALADAQFDVLIASRLFTVVREREKAIAEMHRVLRPGGLCFIAEPLRLLRASIPLIAMWALACATRFHNGYREPHFATILSRSEFARLLASAPWKRRDCWRDERYQYALCEKE
jgi:ubiquinone/menaquinone biosynthesis C-methylase UbiE